MFSLSLGWIKISFSKSEKNNERKVTLSFWPCPPAATGEEAWPHYLIFCTNYICTLYTRNMYIIYMYFWHVYMGLHIIYMYNSHMYIYKHVCVHVYIMGLYRADELRSAREERRKEVSYKWKPFLFRNFEWC